MNEETLRLALRKLRMRQLIEERQLPPVLRARLEAVKAARPKRAKISDDVKEKLWRDYCGACAYCGNMLYQFSAWPYHFAEHAREEAAPYLPVIDHKQPLSKGGTDDIDNLCLACWHCNSSKGKKTEQEFRGKP